MGTGGLPDEFPSATMAVVFWGEGGPICHLKSGMSSVTEKRDKINFNHERISAALIQYLIFK